MKKYFKKNWPLILITAVSAVVYWRWLNFSVFANQDWGYTYFSETFLSWSSFSIWQANNLLGAMDIALFRAPLYLFYWILKIFPLDGNVLDKILFFWPQAFLTGIFSFLFLKYIFKNNIAAVIGSFVYCYNTYFIAIATQGHNTLNAAAIFVPLSMLFFVKALDRKNIAYSIWAALILFLSASYDFRTFYIAFFILIFYFAYFFFVETEKEKKFTQKVKEYFPVIFIFGIVSLGLNLYWILAFQKASFLATNEGMGRDVIPYSLNLSRVITLFHPFWTGGVPEWFDGQDIPFYFWLVPVLSILGLVLGRKNKKVLFFGIVSLLGIILSKQTADPFSDLYFWLRTNLPGFSAFREASKFYLFIIVSYSVLIAAFVDWVWKIKNKKSKYFKYAIIFGVAFLFLWNTKSMIDGDIKTLFVAKSVPSEDLQLKEFLKKDREYSRVLWVPSEPYWALWDNTHPKMKLIEAKKKDWKEFAAAEGDFSSDSQRLFSILQQDFSPRLLNISSIRYVVSDQNGYFDKKLEELDYLQKMDTRIKGRAVYENEDVRPHVYLTKNLETIHRDQDFQKLEYRMGNPSKYTLEIKNIKSPAYLNFSERFHPDWKIRIGEFHWYSVLAKNNYFVSDDNHFENDAKLNSFHLDPEQIKKNYPKDSYKTNPDGSLDLKITLFFRPQSYLYLGLLIFGATLLASLAYLVYIWQKNRKFDK